MTKEKALSILSYVGPLFLVALLVEKDNADVKFHTNQGAVLFVVDLICLVAGWIFGLIPVVGWIVSAAISLALLVLMVIGIIHAWKEENTELPIIGGVTLIK